MNRIWAIATLAVALTSSAAHAAAPIYGDADGNGTVNIADVQLLARVAGGLAPITDTIRRNCDVAPLNDYNNGSFGDGSITMLDVERVWRKANNKEVAEWPAKVNAYQLEVGNTFTTRKYDAGGNPTGAADVVSTVNAPEQDIRSGITYVVNPVRGSDGSEQRLVTAMLDTNNQPVTFTDSQGRAALGATKFTFGDSISTFDPPMVLLVYPIQAGTTWTGTTKAVISGQNANATYTGTISGPETVDVPAGHFEDAYKVTIAYNATASLATATGEEYYWFVPFLGPVQHGFTRTITSFLGSQTKTVNPDIKLVAASVHGVQFP